jgi:hypothetical protein
MRDCQTRDGTWNDAVRSTRGCGLYDIRRGMMPVEPKPTREALYWPTFGAHMKGYRGRYPDRRLVGTDYLGYLISDKDWKYPPEDSADGCPGAWYRTPWVDSVDQYSRRRTESGDRVSNHLLDDCDDWLIHAAVRALEGEEERWHAYIAAERDRRWEVAEKKREREATSRRGPVRRGRR